MDLKSLGLLLIAVDLLANAVSGFSLGVLDRLVIVYGIALVLYSAVRDRIEKTRMNANIVLLMLILLTLSLGLYRLDYKSMWLDEVYTVYDSRGGEISIINSWYPLHLAITRLFLRLGISDFTARLPSVLFGLLAAYLSYRLAEVLYGRTEGLLTMLLMSTSAFYMSYMQEARLYMLFAMLSTASLYLFYRALNENKRFLWACFALMTALNVHTSFMAVLVLLSEVAYLVLLLKGYRHVLLNFAGSVVSAAILSLIGVYYTMEYSNMLISGDFTWVFKSTLSPTSLMESFGGLFGRVYTSASYILPVVFVLLFIYGVIKSFDRRGALLIMFILIPVSAGLLFSSVLPMQPKYLLFIFPAYVILISKGLSSIKNRELAAAIVIGILILGAYNLVEYYQSEKDDWRSTALYLKSNIQNEDKIIAIPPFVNIALEYYGIEPKSIASVNSLGEKPAGRTWIPYNTHTQLRDLNGKIKQQLDDNCTMMREYTGIQIYLCS